GHQTLREIGTRDYRKSSPEAVPGDQQMVATRDGGADSSRHAVVQRAVDRLKAHVDLSPVLNILVWFEEGVEISHPIVKCLRTAEGDKGSLRGRILAHQSKNTRVVHH